MRSPSPSNATPRSKPPLVTSVLQRREVGGAAADVDVVAVRLVADRFDLGAELVERARRDIGVRTVRAVDRDAQTAEVGAEALEHVLEVAVDGDVDVVDLAAARSQARRAALRSPPPPRRSACDRAVSKNFTPLYSGGLCDAVMTTPRSRPSSATAGVGTTPASTAEPPADATPRANASSSSSPEPRVSRPTKTRPPPDQSADALPRRSTSSTVMNSPTMPRTPSVPK